MRNTLYFFVSILFFFSCGRGLDIHFNDKDAHKIMKLQCEQLPDTICVKFKKNYEDLLYMNALGAKGKMGAIQTYSKSIENITLQDVLEKSLKHK